MRSLKWHVWRYPVGLVIGTGLALGIFKLGLALHISLYTAFIVVAVLWQLSSRIPFGIASACLIGIIIVSILVPNTNGTQSNLREQLAMGAVYCLVVGIILLIREQIGRPKKEHAGPTSSEADEAAAPDPAHTHGLSDIAVPKAPLAPRPVVQRPLQATQPAKASPAPPAHHTPYKPHLAPHPLLRPAQPKPAVQAPIQPASNSRIINDVMRPAPRQSTQSQTPPGHPTRQGQRRRLIQL